MANSSFHLYQLQKVDLRLDQIESTISKINEKIQNNQTVKVADQLVKESEAEINRINLEISGLEETVNKKSIKVNQSEASLYKGTNLTPKELGDLQKEIVSLKNVLHSLEENQFNLLSEFEIANDILIKNKNNYNRVLDEFNNSNSILMKEIDELKKEKGKLLLERQEVIAQIPPDHLSIYEKLRLSKNRIAVTAIEDESCTCCGSEVSAANIQKAKSSIILTTCPSCGRILYTG